MAIQRNYKVLTFSLEMAVFEKLEKLRGNSTRFRREFVNRCLLEKLGLPVAIKK